MQVVIAAAATQTFWSLSGVQWALMGAGLAFIGGAIGSSIGITYAANVGAGILAEDPDKFGRLVPIIAMPGTQGVYGFITAFLVWLFFVRRGVAVPNGAVGFQVFASCLPVAFGCLFSAIYQGLTGTGAAAMVGKRPESSGIAIILPALVETYAVFSLVVSVLLILTVAKLI